ncbi:MULTISPECIES: glycosyltransferase family 4 protein [Marinomonas]|uniref:Glycosyltransferase family 4 protein n=1 Tax=Marinomonas rhodophyticola TaxID=2992803 RepID=A0ABT3KKC7_9GAMM|nr:glycosyltransferase family 4 protein [Marinomonas sp. KJ51-3]MCW4631011.1 glycosyltransferase family 4 protein [Marinomonas sp. KJ51-3]
MKILILTFYYAPDLCAGSFRTTALVDKLKKIPDVELEVITTLPNRYASFSADAPEYEIKDGVEVHRIPLPSHNSGMLDQVKAFTAFYKQAVKLTNDKHYDLVFATSSRLFTAFLGARIASSKKLPLYLDIRDIFVDTIKDVLSPKITWIVKPLFSLIESYTFRKAKRINLVSKGFADYFSSCYPKAEYKYFTNGIDNEFLAVAPQTTDSSQRNDVSTVLYAGNIGEGQGLHTILPKLAKRLEGKVQFRIIGDGGRKALLQLQLAGVTNVELLPPVSRSELIKEYQNADVLFLHLNDYPAFRKVLPSKIFEYAALGKPVWAGVSGYAADFLKEEVDNSSVFYPSNDEQAYRSFDALEFGVRPRREFISKFSREQIMTQMAHDIVEFGEKNEQ